MVIGLVDFSDFPFLYAPTQVFCSRLGGSHDTEQQQPQLAAAERSTPAPIIFPQLHHRVMAGLPKAFTMVRNFLFGATCSISVCWIALN